MSAKPSTSPWIAANAAADPDDRDHAPERPEEAEAEPAKEQLLDERADQDDEHRR